MSDVRTLPAKLCNVIECDSGGPVDVRDLADVPEAKITAQVIGDIEWDSGAPVDPNDVKDTALYRLWKKYQQPAGKAGGDGLAPQTKAKAGFALR